MSLLKSIFLTVFLFTLNSPCYAFDTNEEVTYCVDPDWMPYEAVRNGQHIGISADYLKLVSDFTGLTFRLIPTESLQETISLVEDGECMITSMINQTPSRSNFLLFSAPYLEAPNVLVAREGTPLLQGYGGVGHRVVGIVSGYRDAEYVARYYPNVVTEYVKSEADGFRKLGRGEIDVMVASLLSVYSIINNQKLDNIVLAGFAEPFDMLSFGVNKQFPELLPILNSAISSISEKRKVEIYKRWNNIQQQSQSSKISPYVLCAGLFVLSVVLVYLWSKRVITAYENKLLSKSEEIESLQSSLLEKNRTLEFLSSHDSVTGLYNRNYLMHRGEEEISRFIRFKSPASLLIIQIDEQQHNSVTDNTVKGESLHKLLATICLSTVREVDIAAKWSPESFAILCPITKTDEAESLAERLVEAILKMSELKVTAISIGIAGLVADSGFSQWSDNAVRAVTQSRREGIPIVKAE